MGVFGYKVELMISFPVIWHLAIAQPLNFGDIMSFHSENTVGPKKCTTFSPRGMFS